VGVNPSTDVKFHLIFELPHFQEVHVQLHSLAHCAYEHKTWLVVLFCAHIVYSMHISRSRLFTGFNIALQTSSVSCHCICPSLCGLVTYLSFSNVCSSTSLRSHTEEHFRHHRYSEIQAAPLLLSQRTHCCSFISLLDFP